MADGQHVLMSSPRGMQTYLIYSECFCHLLCNEAGVLDPRILKQKNLDSSFVGTTEYALENVVKQCEKSID
jgi:hypothetical protein